MIKDFQKGEDEVFSEFYSNFCEEKFDLGLPQFAYDLKSYLHERDKRLLGEVVKMAEGMKEPHPGKDAPHKMTREMKRKARNSALSDLITNLTTKEK